MIYVDIYERGGWRELPNGPFPIEREQLEKARNRFADELKGASRLGGARMAPATVARSLLEEEAPRLSTFDNMVLAYAVTIKRIRIR